jgi:hypothetical protein
VKICCSGVLSNCAKLEVCQKAMFEAGVVDSMCRLLKVSSSPLLSVNCLDTLGTIADNRKFYE